MLEFFRKYQRYFFIFVTVVIIVTFSLFGSYKTFGQADGRKEIVVGHAIDGSKLKYFEIKQLSALLGAESGRMGVIGNEFLKTGVADILAQAFYEPLKGDWQSRLDRVKRCRFYVHPSAPFLNAQDLWKHLAPDAIRELRVLQEMPEAGEKFFASWSRLYLLQEQYPSELIKRVLLYQQNQYQIPSDPRLFSEDCSLLGFHGTGEWFGPQFTDLVAQFILNGAAMAEGKGYSATRAEAEVDLARRFSSKEQSLDSTLRSVGVQKNEAIGLWQRVVLFQHYFQAVGQAALLDDLSYRSFSEFAHETAVIDVYRLPKELQLRSIDDFVSFEIYKRLACASCDSLSCPNSLLSVNDVEQRAPELVYKKYHLKCAQIDLQTLQSRLSMREVWSWQTEPQNWTELKRSFAEISDQTGKTPFEVLEKLDPLRRAAIDDWSRQRIVDAHPEWVEQELNAAALKDQDLYIFANSDIVGLSIERSNEFEALLDRSVAGDASAADSLKNYREKNMIWRVNSVGMDKKTVISFADAKKMNRINPDSFLEEEYYIIRNQTPSLFQNENGDYLPFSEVKEKLVSHVFAALFRALDDEVGEHEDSLAYYIQHRFDPWMQQALASLKEGNDLSGQCLWPIEKSERTINRTSSEEWIMKQPFILKADEWSDVYVPPDGEIVFFFVKEHTRSPSPVLEQIQQGQQTLANDIKSLMAQQLLNAALKKQSLILPLSIEQEKDVDL